MTPVEVLEDVKAFLEDKLKDLRPFGMADNFLEEKQVKVHLYHLPSPDMTPMSGEGNTGYAPQDFEGILPAVTVSPLRYEPSADYGDMARLSVAMTVGVYSEDPLNQDGPRAVINILNRMQNAFAKNRRISERCMIDGEPGWELFDETNRPVWQGEMIINILLAVPFGELSEDWRADFLMMER